jgi:hypothetical protein
MSAKYRDAICYIDTNILIYLFDRAEPAKQQLSKFSSKLMNCVNATAFLHTIRFIFSVR